MKYEITIMAEMLWLARFQSLFLWKVGNKYEQVISASESVSSYNPCFNG
jgi:hypothetical protein